MNDLKVVTIFTMKEMLKRKSFIVTTIIILLLIILGFNIPNIINFFNKDSQTAENTELLIVDPNNIFEGSLDNLNSMNLGYNVKVSNENLTFDDIKSKIENEEIKEAIIVEKTDEDVPPIEICIETIGSGYKALISPYGMERHPLSVVAQTRGFEFATYYNNAVYMSGADVFTFSIKDAPRVTKAFLQKFNKSMDDFDLISIHQANKMIIDNVAKRIKAPKEKLMNSIARFGNTRGASTAVNICDYAEENNIVEGNREIFILGFGVGLNVTVASINLDMSVCLPIIKTTDVYDDGIDSETYFK